jgi:hypothetical protein
VIIAASLSSVVTAEQEDIAKRAAKIREARDVERKQLRALIAARRREKDKHYIEGGGGVVSVYNNNDNDNQDDGGFVIITPSGKLVYIQY